MVETKRRGIELTEEQWRMAKSRAASQGITLSEWFGRMVDATNLKTHVQYQKPLSEIVIGRDKDPRPSGPSFNTRPFTPVPKKGK